MLEKTSVVDPDSVGSRDLDSQSGSGCRSVKMAQKNRVEGLSCSLGRPLWRLGMSKLQFMIKERKFNLYFLFYFWPSKP